MLIPSEPASKTHQWIATWTSSAQPLWGDELPFPTNMAAALGRQTLCQSLRVSLGGRRLRLVFSNEYGTQPLVLGPVSVALGHDAGERWPVTFAANPHVSIPAGKTVVSDPLQLDIPALAELCVRGYLPEFGPVSTFHWDARRTTRILPGNHVLADMAAQHDAIEITARPVLSAVWVEADADAAVVAVIGDSLVDGNGVSIDSDNRWTDHLATRLAAHAVAVVNAGQSGSRLLRDRIGISTTARFARDVLDVPGVRLGIVQVGLNDLGWAGTALEPGTAPPSAQALIDGYRDLLAKASGRGVPLVGVTLTPFKGAFAGTPFEDFFTPEKEAVRQQVNAWMRNAKGFAAVLDSDALLCDPEDAQRLRADLDAGDHLHPHDEGNRLIGESISLETLLALLRR